MTRFQPVAALVAGALILAAPALADGALYPRIVGSGENASVEYGPNPPRNVVGGGAVEARDATDGGAELHHSDARFAQPGRTGVRAVTIGNGEDQHTVWLPLEIPASAVSWRGSAERG